MENKSVSEMFDKEKLDKLESMLEKETSISDIAEELQISEFAVIGYKDELVSKGRNISYNEKNGEAYLKINNHPDFSKENEYRIEEDIETGTKIGFISDLRFGSKHEQIAILNDIYRKFAEEGVSYVIITGNLIEGVYTKSQMETYGNSLIKNVGNDPISQADHLVEYFPRVEGIKTLFISGNNEHNRVKDVNIGKYIAKKRDDMIYLGPRSCTVYFNNVSFKIEQLKTGKAYTISYPPQEYSRSLPCYEDYDVIVLGNTNSAQDFPKIRGSVMLTVPSVGARTPLMKERKQQDTMGALIANIEYNKTGKLKRITRETLPYYKPSDENYLTVKKLNIKKDEIGNLITTDMGRGVESAYFDTIYKFYSRFKKEETLDSLASRLKLSYEDLYGIISMMREYGLPVEIVDENGTLVVKKFFLKRRHNIVKPPKEELYKKEFLVVCDTHFGNKACQPSMVKTSVYEAYNRGITDIFHGGDITDGEYRNRPEQVRETFLYGMGAGAQVRYAVETLPKYKGMTWHVINGNHDKKHMDNCGVNVGYELSRLRDDVEYLGDYRAIYPFDNCKIELLHPGGGSSKIYSSRIQSGIDQMDSGTKPNLSLRAHYHKYWEALYRNMFVAMCPCNVDITPFMMTNELANKMGNVFITIWYDDNGDIQYYKYEPMLFGPEDVRKDDYDHPIILKNKLITK